MEAEEGEVEVQCCTENGEFVSFFAEDWLVGDVLVLDEEVGLEIYEQCQAAVEVEM